MNPSTLESEATLIITPLNCVSEAKLFSGPAVMCYLLYVSLNALPEALLMWLTEDLCFSGFSALNFALIVELIK